MTKRIKIDRSMLIEKGFLILQKPGRPRVYQSEEELHEAKLRHSRIANSNAHQRLKEAHARYLETLLPDTPSEPCTSEPCTS